MDSDLYRNTLRRCLESHDSGVPLRGRYCVARDKDDPQRYPDVGTGSHTNHNHRSIPEGFFLMTFRQRNIPTLPRKRSPSIMEATTSTTTFERDLRTSTLSLYHEDARFVLYAYMIDSVTSSHCASSPLAPPSSSQVPLLLRVPCGNISDSRGT